MSDTTDTDADAEYDETTHVERTDHGVSLTTEIKRGTGTRDQDKHVIKAKGGSFEEAAHYHRQALAYLDGGDPQDGTVLDRVRSWDPERGQDGDGDA